MDAKFYVYCINLMGSVWYLEDKDAEDCTLWENAPIEKRATFTREEANAKVEWLKKRWPYSSSKYYAEIVIE